MQQQQDAAVSFCPSFNSYASDELVSVAAKVSEEFREEESKSKSKVFFEEEEYVDEDEFEFVSTIADLDSRFFLDGEIRQVFPVFNRSLLLNEDCDDHDRGNVAAALKKLFIDDHDDDDGRQASPSSSSDEDEPEPEQNMNVTFCIWTPKRNNNIPRSSPSPSQSPSRCKKSNSIGSSSSSTPSKKWCKFRDLLKRSNSDGQDSFVFLSKPKNNNNSNKNSSNNVDSSKEKKVKSGKVKAKARASAASAHEAFYVKNRAIKEGDKRRSYLPYRQDLLGVFANYNALYTHR